MTADEFTVLINDHARLWRELGAFAGGFDPSNVYRRKDAEDVSIEILNIFERLRAALEAAKRVHTSCDDCWYSCPKSEYGCCDESQVGCNCGAEKHNAAIDAELTPSAGPNDV